MTFYSELDSVPRKNKIKRAVYETIFMQTWYKVLPKPHQMTLAPDNNQYNLASALPFRYLFSHVSTHCKLQLPAAAWLAG